MNGPHYPHDCEHCVFVAIELDTDSADNPADVYVCPSHRRLPTDPPEAMVGTRWGATNRDQAFWGYDEGYDTNNTAFLACIRMLSRLKKGAT